MKLPHSSLASNQAGYTLITTLVLTAMATAILSATLSRTYTTAKLNDRENAYQMANGAAEAATEKVLSRMMVDFRNNGELGLSNNITTYRTGMLPTSSENPYWTNFQFWDGQGNSNATYVVRTTTNPNPPYVTLLQQYPGLNAFAATYRVVSNVKYTNSPYNLIGAVQQEVQMAELPVFQFAIFYNTLLEFTDAATLTVNGRVHCNTNIYIGSPSDLTFNYTVESSGIITNPAWFGLAKTSWTGHTNFNGTPAPGYSTHSDVLILPIGTNSLDPNSVREIINPPPVGEATTNPISPQRYYNQADMVITITNPVPNTSTNFVNSNNYSVWIKIKNSYYDGSPSNIFLGTNVSLPNTASNIVNWANTGVSSWLSTNYTFFDQREGRTNLVTQIDVAQLGIWIGSTNGGATNTNCSVKWPGGTHFNGIIYVDDNRTTNANLMTCVRLVNGVNITNGLYAKGLTLATQNPLYIVSNYNCPNSAWWGTSNTTRSRPCSFACDALTILSAQWGIGGWGTNGTGYDAISKSGYASRTANSTTVNAAFIAGNVLSTDATDTGFSGGVHNYPRLLEDWTGDTLTLNSSMINLYPSVQAAKQFQKPGIYYKPPTRNFLFDNNFTTSGGLPPGTPMINLMVRATWCNPQPNNVTNYSILQDFVPR